MNKENSSQEIKLYDEARETVIQQPTLYNLEDQRAVEMPNSYLFWSVFNFLCCCWPVGLFAVYYSIRTNETKRINSLGLAKSYSSKAYVSNLIASICGSLMLFVVLPILVYIQLNMK